MGGKVILDGPCSSLQECGRIEFRCAKVPAALQLLKFRDRNENNMISCDDAVALARPEVQTKVRSQGDSTLRLQLGGGV